MHYLKKELYERVASNPELFDFIQEVALDGLWYWDLEDPEHEWMNPKFWTTLGYNPEEMPHKASAWQEIIFKEDLAIASKNAEKHFYDKDHPYDQVVRYHHKTGRTVWIRCKGIAIRDENGKCIRMLGAHIDISAEKEKEELLYRCNDEASIGFWEVDLIENTVYWSDTTKRIHGVSQDYVPDVESGINFYKEGKSRDTITRVFNEVIEKQETQTVELIIVSASGEDRWIKSILIPKVFNGKCIAVYGTFQDIHERKVAEERVRQSEESFRTSFENSAIGMAIISREGKWLKVNKEVPKILGYTREELNIITFQDLTHPEDLHKDLANIEKLIAGSAESYQMEKRYIHKDGYVVYAILAVSCLRHENGVIRHFISQIVDISKQKQTQIELEASSKYNQAILDSSTSVSIITTDVNGIIKSFNRGAEKRLGYYAEEFVDQGSPAFFHDKDEIKVFAQRIQNKIGKKVKGFGVFKEIAQNHAGIGNAHEWTYIAKSGYRFPVLLTITPLYLNGEITGYMGIATDITESRKAKTELQTLLHVTQEQNDRLKGFAQIVSHNLRSHSSNIDFMIDIFREEEPAASKSDVFTNIKKASTNLKQTISHLNEIVVHNTSNEIERTNMNLRATVNTTIESVRAIAEDKNVTLENHITEDIVISVIPAYIESILLNLLTNGIKYSSPQRDSYVKVKALIDKVEKRVVISFEDNGIGINLERHSRRLFKMYATFHTGYDSRGIGLFLTKNQVETLGGSISVESKEGVGSTFQIKLPYQL